MPASLLCREGVADKVVAYCGTVSEIWGADVMMDASLEEIDLDLASALAEQANRHMRQHGVAPTPNNFAIWFNYSRGILPELKRTVDIVIAGKKRFDAVT